MSHTLRTLHSTEVESVGSWAIAEGWPGREKSVQLTAQEFLEILRLPGHKSYCMSEPGLPPLGFGQIWLSPKGTVNLVRIIVDPSLRGKGLGRQLSALLLSEARKLPEASVIWFRVLRSNTVALSVYKSLGFRIVESESNSGVYALAAG